MIKITSGALPLAETMDALRHPDCGAVISYLGTVRSYLAGRQSRGLSFVVTDEEMKTSLESVRSDALRNFDIRDMAIVHRTGSFDVGDEILLIVISAGHRGPAFDACLGAIDRIKELHEIWKREELADESVG